MSDAPAPSGGLASWLDYLQQVHPRTIELGLDRVLAVWAKMRCSRPGRVIITVGGTNGKGSTVAAMEALLLARGAKVGVYTSPHIHVYNERVRVNGQCLSDAELVQSFAAVESARGAIPLTYFEFGTLGALHHFANAGLDVAILEVGLGGRMDAVNIIDADLSIVTCVDLDHMEWLGSTRELIGYEKAGIFRPFKDALYGEPDPPVSVLQFAQAQKVRLQLWGRDYGQRSEAAFVIRQRSGDALVQIPPTPLPTTNLVTAVQALATLGLDFSQDEVTSILAGLRVPGRMETLMENPWMIADVGHNPHAARFIAERLQVIRGARRVVALYSALQDKDARTVMATLAQVVDEWHIVPLTTDRAKPVSVLVQDVSDISSNYQTHPSAGQALDHLLRKYLDAPVVIIALGSFYLVEAARNWRDEQQKNQLGT